MAGSPIIASVRGKVARLIAEHRALSGSVDELTGRNNRLRAQNRELSLRIDSLEKRISMLELRSSMTGDGDLNRANARINSLMREVDRCLALMNRD